MKADWCGWMSLIDHKPASVNVDCNARNPETEKLHDFIAIIIHDLGASRNGFPTREKFEEIYSFEDKLEKIANKNTGKYTGRFITNGEGYYLIYTNNTNKIKQKLEGLVKEFTFPYEFVQKEDKDWKLYFDTIYPPAKQKERYQTSVLLRNIAAEGDNPDEEHSIDHGILFKSKEDRKKYFAALKKAKFPIEKYQEFDDENKTFFLEVSVKSPLKADLINNSTDILIDLAEKYNAVYDGWGTALVK